jgi:hypothetical protein
MATYAACECVVDRLEFVQDDLFICQQPVTSHFLPPICPLLHWIITSI